MSLQRTIARLCGTYHNITYYAPEIKSFKDVGIARYWHAYLGYRSAPMGRVPAPVVTATFYNFAPARVEAAIPAIWEHITPPQAIALRDSSVDRALTRVLGDAVASDLVVAAARIARVGIEDCDVAGRPLFAAHAALPWPDAAHMQLHHACTMWREHRGDGHNIALAAAEIDGVECHALLASRGVTGPVIEKLRGWTATEWDAAQRRLVERGLLDENGSCTASGRAYRDAIEDHTDRLAAAPLRRLGDADARALVDALEPVVRRLVDAGAVDARWPPASAR